MMVINVCIQKLIEIFTNLKWVNFMVYKLYLKKVSTVAHVCNPDYSGGRNQENYGSKTARAKSSQDPILKIPNTKKGLVEWLKW
jgi:hypothetical protein